MNNFNIQILQFLESCSLTGKISTDDLGYLTKWYFENKEITTKEYFNKILEMTNLSFFDTNITIFKIVNDYNEFFSL